MKYDDLWKTLQTVQLPLTNEWETQNELEKYLKEKGVVFEREYRLAKDSRIDFLVDGSIGIEIKVRGSAPAIYRQCKRYLKYNQVKGLFLLTSKTIGLPAIMYDKPAAVISLSRAWM